MKRSKWVGIVFGIIAIGFLMMPMLAGAQEGATITFISDADLTTGSGLGPRANGFMSNDEHDAGARFFDSSGAGLEIVKLAVDGFINTQDPLLCAGGNNGSLRVEFDELLADLSIQVSVLNYDAVSQQYFYDEGFIPESATVTVKTYLNESQISQDVVLSLNVVDIPPDGPRGYYLTIGPCANNGDGSDDCTDVFPNGFDAVEIEFSNNLPECVDNIFGNPKRSSPTCAVNSLSAQKTPF